MNTKQEKIIKLLEKVAKGKSQYAKEAKQLLAEQPTKEFREWLKNEGYPAFEIDEICEDLEFDGVFVDGEFISEQEYVGGVLESSYIEGNGFDLVRNKPAYIQVSGKLI